ncbi:MAG: hypothetical protein ABIQ55_03830 [Gemmatimonadaceae bacterium]
MTTSQRLDDIRGSVLDRMERAERGVRLAIAGAAVAEMALFVVAFTLIDWNNHIERLLFIFSVLSYTTIAFGLVALGAHVTRSVARLAGALEAAGSPG